MIFPENSFALCANAVLRVRIMLLAIVFALALAGTAANAQGTRSGPPSAPAVAGVNGTTPFLFDGRMRGDGARKKALADDHHPNAGAVVMPPKTSEPGR
ncbi:hypothetical protein [Bradyrhizobium sp. B117]|uniref:hypothetical protein n=1 Tax=Bradyrhizobium sp. B117 TaxID=3140246 RepID=UPI003183025A